jgi:uncharacterized membrane protein YfcA
MTKNLLLFAIINFATCILSGASGVGGAIVSTPLMVLLGLTPAQAIATAKFSGFGISLGASSRFYREKITDKRTVIIFSIMGAIGALAGSLTLAHFSDNAEIIQRLMGLVILVIGIPLLYLRGAGLTPKTRPRWIKILGLALLGLGVFMQVAIGAGIGSLQMLVLIGCFGMTALVANATRRAMQLTVATVSLIVFITVGLVDYKFGLVGLVTSLAGGYIGAHLAVKKGNKFIVNMFAVVSALLALQLLFG